MNGASLAHSVRHQLRVAPAATITRIDRWLALFGVAMIAGCAVAGIAASLWIARKAAPPPPTRSITIGGAPLTLPTAWVRRVRTGADGAAEWIDLEVPWRDIAPGAADDLSLVLSLTASVEGAPPDDRPLQLYARFLSAVAYTGEAGLIRREFRAGSPFEGETLFLAPPDGRAFWARCTAEGEQTGAETCRADLRLGRLDVQARFAPELLARWRAVAKALKERFGGAP